MNWLKLLLPLLNIFSNIMDAFRWSREKQEAAVVAEAEISKKEADATREAASIVGKRVPDSVATDRLRSGTF